MRPISYFISIYFIFYFSHNIDILRISTITQKYSLLKLTAANQNPGADHDPTLRHRLDLEILHSYLSRVDALLNSIMEMWRARCEGLPSSQLMEDFCKELLAHIKVMVANQEYLRDEISKKEATIENLQAANN